MGCLKLTEYKQKLPRRWTVLCRDFRRKNTTNYNYQFDYDNIGNRIFAENNSTRTNYTTNNLNQYENMGDFIPTFDDDGNQTKIKTSKGEFLVEYNGENRPIKFTNLSDSTFITMRYDYMGRRGGKLHFNSQGTWTSTVKFFYKDYTLIEESTASNDVLKEFIWDPTAGEATKPLVFFNRTRSTILYYAHDANKNVTELVYNAVSSGMGAHYEYDVFGNIIVSQNYTMIGLQKLSDYNPFRFSSEYHDDELSLIYYNYRHYNPTSGRWINRDPIEEKGGYNLYGMCDNNTINYHDNRGLTGPQPICPKCQKGVGACTCGNDPPLSLPTNCCPKETRNRFINGIWEYKTKTPTGQEKTFNGCSTPQTGRFIFNFDLWDEVFKESCNSHDICYRTCDYPRDGCDMLFKQSMIQACDNYDGDINDCISAAINYYAGVSGWGESSYQEAQDSMCKWAPCPLKKEKK